MKQKNKKSTSRFQTANVSKLMPVSKRSQHEIAGFVLIVVLVSIIGIIFLGFMIGRGEPIKQESVHISHLLAASMHYTSDCVVGYVPKYKDGQDLIKSCWKNDKCLDDKLACEVLNSTMKELIGKSLNVNPEIPNKAYELIIYYKSLDEEIPNEMILELSEGNYSNCNSEIGGSHPIPIIGLDSGNIKVELSVCKGKEFTN